MHDKNTRSAIVVGGGLAGLSCAMYLLRAGVNVVLLERDPYMGGRTASWDEDGMKVESGLHRFLGFFTELPKLLRLAGVNPNKILYWEDEIIIRLKNKRPASFGVSILKPFKTIKGVLGNLHILNFRDKLRLVKLFTLGLKDYLIDPHKLDALSIYDYARNKGIPEKVIRNIIEPLSTGLFFLPPKEYSAFVFFGVFVPFIPRLYKMRVGAFLGGMTEVMANPIAQKLTALGGKIILDTSVDSLLFDGQKVIGVRAENRSFYAQQVILAASLVPAQKIIKKSLGGNPWFLPMLKLPSMPSVTIQMELSKPATDKDRTTFAPETVLAAFAEQSRSTFRHALGRLSVILTPPDDLIKMQPEEILEKVIHDAESIGLFIRNTITNYKIIVEPADFYRLSPGSEALKPTQETPVEGLVLAGDYTKQKYLATMEGAVYSGRLAANVALKNFKNGRH